MAAAKKQPTTKKVLLTAKQLENLGHELTEIMNVLEMANLAIEGIEFAQNQDQNMGAWMARKYFEIAYAQNENLHQRLDDTAFLLLNSDKANELEAAGHKVEVGND